MRELPSHQQRTGVCNRRIRTRQSLRFRSLLATTKTENCCTLLRSVTGSCQTLGVKWRRDSKGLQIDTCPFVNLPEKERMQWALTREEMKNCVWVKPELFVQVEFGEWTPDAHLGHSKFVVFTEDKHAADVIREDRN